MMDISAISPKEFLILFSTRPVQQKQNPNLQGEKAVSFLKKLWKFWHKNYQWV